MIPVAGGAAGSEARGHSDKPPFSSFFLKRMTLKAMPPTEKLASPPGRWGWSTAGPEGRRGMAVKFSDWAGDRGASGAPEEPGTWEDGLAELAAGKGQPVVAAPAP